VEAHGVEGVATTEMLVEDAGDRPPPGATRM
jgi:hypothetical protein